MVARSDNISFDIELINSSISEMRSVDDKKKFLNKLVNNRLNLCNKECIDSFNFRLDLIERQLDPENVNLSKLCRSIKSISKAQESLYKTQMILYKIL